jgi:hypothetical protein
MSGTIRQTPSHRREYAKPLRNMRKHDYDPTDSPQKQQETRCIHWQGPPQSAASFMLGSPILIRVLHRNVGADLPLFGKLFSCEPEASSPVCGMSGTCARPLFSVIGGVLSVFKPQCPL